MAPSSTPRRIGIVGCGVVGASVGWHLARTGAQVTWFERAAVGDGTSNSSLAWVNASSAADDPGYFEFRRSALDEWARVHSTIGGDGWWHPTGRLQWGDGETADELRASFEMVTARGYPGELLDVATAQALEPAVQFGTATPWVAYYPGEGWIDPRIITERFVESALKLGASLRTGTPVAAIEATSNRVTGVRMSDGDHMGLDVVINAAGPDAAAVAAMVGRTLPVHDEPGLVVRLLAPRPLVSRVMHAPGVELRPDGHRRVLVHSGLFDADLVAGARRDELAPRLVALGVDVVPPLAEATVLESRVGRRPMPADQLPCVGGVHAVAGYYEAVMHSGVTLAAIVGRLLADTVLGDAPDPRLSRFRPDRFG